MTRTVGKARFIYKDESYAIEHRAQLLNYLSATGCELGLLVNFGHYPKIEYQRLITRKQESADVYL